MALSREDAARRLGMAVAEVVQVHDAGDGGSIVVTHDGYPTLVTADDQLVFGPEAIGGRLDVAGVAAPVVSVDEESVDDAGGGPLDDVEVPDGTAAEVLAWVGDDPDRAGQALAHERARDRPRASVTGPLEKLLTPEQEPAQ